MFASRFFQLLLVLAAVICLSQASYYDEHRERSIAVDARQDTGASPDAGGSGSKTPTSVPVPPGATPTPTDSSSSSEPISSSTSESSSSSSSAQETSSSTTSSAHVTSPSESATEPGPPTTPTPTQDPTSSSSTPLTTFTRVTTKTDSHGSKTVETETGVTPVPNNQSGKDSGSSGMKEGTKKTVIGVVVGIGGAIVLGALALVGYRIWGRRRHNEENDGLMDYNMGTGGVEKHEPSGSVAGSQAQHPSPFQSTLENYHQPGQVNASSNF